MPVRLLPIHSTGIVAGGIAPLLFAAIYKAYGSTLRVSLYVVAALAVAVIALCHANETAKAPLANSQQDGHRAP